MRLKLSIMAGLVGLAAGLGLLAPTAAHAVPTFPTGLIVLEGSDAQPFHHLEPYSNNFQKGLQIYSSAPTLPVLAIGSNPDGTAPAGKTFLADLSGLTGADLIADYSGLYIGSPGTCCNENDAVVTDPAAQAAILAFHAAGRSIAIGNYQGGAAFSFLTGFTLTGSEVVGLGTSTGPTCFDGNSITSVGTAFGLGSGMLPTIGCFGHQAYLSSFLTTHGFGADLADNQSLFPGYAVVASNGGGGLPPPTVPEPASLTILGLALAGIGLARRRNA